MISFKNKKTPLSILLISIVLIIFISILKEKRRFPIYNSYGSEIGYKLENVIRFLDIQLLYNDTLFFLFISVIVSILALIFLDDDILKKRLANLKNTMSNLSFKKVFNNSKQTVKTNSILKQKIEKSPEHLESIKILKIKTKAFGYGYILLFIEVFICIWLLKLDLGFSKILIINFLLSLILRFLSAFKCHELAYYNKYSSWFWYLFGFIFPAIGLIFAGSEFSLKKEFIYIYKYKFSQD
jgi:hypothetical protein